MIIQYDYTVAVTNPLPPLAPCIFRDWNPITASSAESAVAAVLAGFVFSGIVVILSIQTRRKFEAAQALKLLFAAFLGLAVTAYLLANDAGEQTCPRADTLVVAIGGLFGTFSFLMLVALTWLVAAYGSVFENVLRLLRALIYVTSVFVILLLCISSQAYVSAELGNRRHLPISLVTIDYLVYGAGVVLILIGATVLARNPLGRLWKRLLRLDRQIISGYRQRQRSAKQWSKDVDRCFVAALAYLAVSALGAGAVVGFPASWYKPISVNYIYVAALASIFLPVPVFVLAARALAQPVDETMTLRNALLKLLSENGNEPESTRQLADEVNDRGLCWKRHGRSVTPDQICLCVEKHHALFLKEGELVRLL